MCLLKQDTFRPTFNYFLSLFFSSILYSSDLSAPVCAFYRFIRGIYSGKTLLFEKTVESFQESDLENTRIFKNRSSDSIAMLDKQILRSYSQNVIKLNISPNGK